jgi:hypothetical protein
MVPHYWEGAVQLTRHIFHIGFKSLSYFHIDRIQKLRA